MATKLAKYDFNSPSKLTLTDRRTYPWDEWLDGSIWRLEWNEDFTAHPLMMERIIRTRATAKGAKINLKHEPQNGDVFGVIIMRRADVEQPRMPRKKAAPTKKAAPVVAKKAPAKKAAPVKKAVSKKAPVRK